MPSSIRRIAARGKIALANTAGAILLFATSESAEPSGSRNWIFNGEFDQSPDGKPPLGWTPAYPTGKISVIKNKEEAFLRLTSTSLNNAGAAQLIAVPPDAKTVRLVARMRGKPKFTKKTEKHAAVEICLRYKKASGVDLASATVSSGTPKSWQALQCEFDLPAGCKKIQLVARSLFAVGDFDFDGIRLEFK
jgi:hypothetical protein